MSSVYVTRKCGLDDITHIFIKAAPSLLVIRWGLFNPLSDYSIQQSLSRRLGMLGTVVCHLEHLHFRLTRFKTNASCVPILAIEFHLGLMYYFKATLFLARLSEDRWAFAVVVILVSVLLSISFSHASWDPLRIFKIFTLVGQTIYIYIYIVIHRQICFVLSELFSVARQVRFPKVGSKPGWLKRQSKILPISHEETSAREGNVSAYVSQLYLFTYIRLTATESSIHMKSLALH